MHIIRADTLHTNTHACTHVHTQAHIRAGTCPGYVHTCTINTNIYSHRYVLIFTYTCMRAQVHTHAHRRAYECTHVHMHTHKYIHVQICTHAHNTASAHKHMCTCVRKYMDKCMHGYTHTYIYMNMHMCAHIREQQVQELLLCPHGPLQGTPWSHPWGSTHRTCRQTSSLGQERLWGHQGGT